MTQGDGAGLRSRLAADPTTFSAYAVQSRSGPHVTMQAGVIHADRFWTTTSQRSLKARSVDAHGVSCAVVRDADGHRVVAGRTSGLRPFRPLDALDDPVAPFRSTSAILQLGADQLEQLLGYFEAASRLPADWLPHRRVLLVTRIDRSLRIDGSEVVDVDGDWTGVDAPALGPDPGWRAELPRRQLPPSHAEVVRIDAPAHLGLRTPTGPVALPASWRGENRFRVSAPALRAVGAELPGRGVAVFDESASRRPDEKLGVMFRGGVTLADIDDREASILVHSERITTWDGFDADTRQVR